MALTPINGSPLHGHAYNRGKSLTLADPNGNPVLTVAVSEAVDRVLVVFETAAGQWRFQQLPQDHGSEITIFDADDRAVATARNGEVALATGENLSWEQTSRMHTRYRLGDDLWVAKRSRGSGRTFRAELSQAMLARDDVSLLAGIASILTQHAVKHQRRRSVVAGLLGG
jgi:hypothetical protein